MGKVKIDELVNDGGVPFVSDEIINQNWSKVQAKLNRKDRKLFWWFNGTFGAVVLVALLSSGLAYGIYVKQKSERNDKTENTLSQINKDKKPLRTKRTEDKSEIVKSKNTKKQGRTKH